MAENWLTRYIYVNDPIKRRTCAAVLLTLTLSQVSSPQLLRGSRIQVILVVDERLEVVLAFRTLWSVCMSEKCFKIVKNQGYIENIHI